MTPDPAQRYGNTSAGEPVLHDLPPIRYEEEDIPLRLEARRAEDGTWRARLVFGAVDSGEVVSTAEIFFGATEPALWDSVRGLRDHHIRDLYRSLKVE